MGFGSFLKKAINPINFTKKGASFAMAPLKAGHKATGKLLHGDVKGAFSAGTKEMGQGLKQLNPFMVGAQKAAAGMQAPNPALTTPQMPQAQPEGGGATPDLLAQALQAGGDPQAQENPLDLERLIGGMRF